MLCALSRRCGPDGPYGAWEPAAGEEVVRLHIDGLAWQPPQRDPLPELSGECRLPVCRLTAHLRHALWIPEARRHDGPGLGLRGVLHRSVSEATGGWTALTGGAPPERRNLRKRGVKHGGSHEPGARRWAWAKWRRGGKGGQHAVPTAYASLRQSRPWKVRKRQPSNASEARGSQGFGGHADSSQWPMR